MSIAYGQVVQPVIVQNTSLPVSISNEIVLKGALDNGLYKNINASESGHLEVEIHGPLSAFGELLTVQPTPLFQNDFVYGVNDEIGTSIQQGSGTVSSANNLLVCSTANNTESLASYRSRQVLDYKPGAGSSLRFTAVYPSPPVNGYFAAIAGAGTSECGLWFGYYSNEFSIIRGTANYRQIVTLTITTKSSDVQLLVITLNGVQYQINMTNDATTSATAYNIAKYNFNSVYNGWICQAVNDTVIFVAGSSGAKNGTYSTSWPLSGAGTFTTTVAGATGTTQVIGQSTWNIDRCDGSNSVNNPSGVLLDPSKGNVYWFKFQYLGFGQLIFGIEHPATGELIEVHRIAFSNSSSSVSLSNPSLPFNVSAVNITNDTAFSISCASYAGFTEGQLLKNNSNQYSYIKANVTLTAGLTSPFLTLRNRLVYKNRVNQSTIYLTGINISNSANTASKTFIIYLVKDVILNNSANFSNYSSNSIAQIDTLATSYTNGVQRYALPSTSLTNSYIDLDKFNFKLDPGSQYTIGVYTNDSNVVSSISLIWFEDL